MQSFFVYRGGDFDRAILRFQIKQSQEGGYSSHYTVTEVYIYMYLLHVYNRICISTCVLSPLLQPSLL